MIVNYNSNCSFTVLATVIMIVNYDRKTLIVQATGNIVLNKLESLSLADLSSLV
jgi:hypothetical protein